ncbi:MAG: XRE family transcriptional regulator [Alcanivorax sp.]|nr:MAG: XRE family transcriptional regulator [Alcanivorax sp.]
MPLFVLLSTFYTYKLAIKHHIYNKIHHKTSFLKAPLSAELPGRRGAAMKNPKQLIGQRISLLRRARHLTQNDLAEGVGVDSRHISRLETGKYFPSLDTLITMAEVLGVELQEFFLFPSVETESEMREALVAIAEEAPEPVLREILSFARNQLAQRRGGGSDNHAGK